MHALTTPVNDLLTWTDEGAGVTVEIADGSAFFHPRRSLLAHLDEDFQEWYSYHDKRGWPILVAEKS